MTAQQSSDEIVLIVEDDQGIAELIGESLRELGKTTTHVTTGAAAQAWLGTSCPALMLLDYSLPDMTGSALLGHLARQPGGAPPFVVTTGAGDERIAVDMMKRGARDYVVKDAQFLDVLPAIVVRVLRELATEHQLSAAQEALRKSEENYRSLFEQATDGIFIIDRQGRFVDVNSSGCRMLGYSRAEILALSMPALAAPDEPSTSGARLAEFQIGGTVHTERRMRRKDGGMIIAEITGTMLPDERMQGIARDITERKRMEEVLHESERRVSALMRNLPGMAYRCRNDSGWTMEFASEGCSALTGYQAADLLGNAKVSWGDLIHPDDRAAIWADVQAGLERRAPFQLTYRIRTIAGEQRWVWEQGCGVFSPDGSPEALEGFIMDITERKLADEALLRERDMAQKYLSLVGVIFVALDPHGVITLVNRKACDILGYAADEMIGRDWFQLCVPERMREDVRGVFGRIMAGDIESVEYYENPALTRSGEERIVAWHNAIITDESGAIAWALSSGEDITERTQAAKIQEAIYRISDALISADSLQELYRAIHLALSSILPTQNFYIALYDEASNLLSFDYFVDQHDQAPPPTTPGHGLTEYVLRTGLPLLAPVEVVEALVRQGEVEEVGAPAVDWLGVPLRTGERTIGVMVVQSYTEGIRLGQRDVDIMTMVSAQVAMAVERKRAEAEVRTLNAELEQRVIERTAELAQANDRLKELDRLKSKFVSDVSHELRTPVANISVLLGLLERGKPEKRDYYLRTSREQTALLAQLIEDILDLSRLERDRDRLRFEKVDWNTVVAPVLSALAPRAEATGIGLTFEPDLHLPPAWGEHNRLKQVATNLIANAINYTRAGEIQVTTFGQDDHVCLEVRDTGMGIAAEDLTHIFERFYRGRQVSQSNIPGTGLGLAIVKEIIELHGGKVEVESRVGQGSTFRVSLPISEQ
ncbi:MAG: PAS domain S-box protein [Chloroflexi bacterium]|nr:PAS domain S-box protein [Chloroflexota bacterium]